MNGFQIGVLIALGFLLIIGVLIFAGILPGFRAPVGGTGGAVVLWGTIPESEMATILQSFISDHKKDFTLTYQAKNSQTFETDFIEALASGKGPDLVFFPQDLILKQGDKLAPISYNDISERTFRDTFVHEGELFLTKDGPLGLPLYLDPLVLYYNQDLLTNAKLPLPPKTWTEAQNEIKALTSADAKGNILQSAIALGQFNNIIHAKDILTLLILQSGSPIVSYGGQGWQSVLKDNNGGASTPPTALALNFWGHFSDSANTLYSWNSSLPEARDQFLRGNLALYLGYASELAKLRQQNPQLNLDVSLVPQPEHASTPSLTLGRMVALAVTRSSRNPKTALQVASLLTGTAMAKTLTNALALPPARNDLLQAPPNDPVQTVFYQSAVISRNWFDPDAARTQAIFKEMSESAQVGQTSVSDAIGRASDELNLLLKGGQALDRQFNLSNLAAVNLVGSSGCTGWGNCNFDTFTKLVTIVTNYLAILSLSVAGIAICYAGIVMVIQPASEDKLKQAKEIFWVAVVGLVLVLGAKLIIKTILDYLAQSQFRIQ